jgi:hypothetical protein
MMLLRFALFAVAACPLLAQGVKIEFDPVSPDVIKTRLGSGPSANAERAAALHKMFEAAGCKGAMLADQEVKSARQPNVICTSAGTTSSTIVIGAHIDFLEGGQGVVENWSGASLLPSLYESLRNTPRKHKFVFVGFADREKGRRGSSFYLKSLKEEDKGGIKAMINLEALGLAPTRIDLEQCDKSLSQKIGSIAKSLNLSVMGANDPRISESDALPFFTAKIPVLSIHSFSGARRPSGIKDDLSAIHLDDYYSSYRLIAAYLVYLDQTLD